MDDLKTVNFIDTGALNVQAIIDNLDALKTAIELIDPHVSYFYSMLGFGSVSVAYDEMGKHTAVERRTHPSMRLVSCYVLLGDGREEDITVTITRNGRDLLAHPIRLRATEKRGKMQIGEALPRQIVTQFDGVEIETSGPRRVAVTMQFESAGVD